MARAVQDLWPEAKLGIGPSIEEGFYYDFEKKEPFVPEDLARIEARMVEIIKKDLPFRREELSKERAKELCALKNQTYKLELIDRVVEDKVSLYWTGEDFFDLCRGPHVTSTGQIKAFKLLSLAGAYWHGIETNPMLTRIYGTAFENEHDLKEYLRLLEEAKKRDHRKLGRELDLFDIYHDEAGQGLVFYHPKGAILKDILESYEKREHRKRGYELVSTPYILKGDLWKTSGHADYYRENMYMFKVEDAEYAVKPMNCPGHILIYKSRIRSYKEMPIRFFELGTVCRHEKSGVLHGLLRVRSFTQDDAHIFCTPSGCEENGGVQQEIHNVLDFVFDTMDVFGFKEFKIELSTRPVKSIGSAKDWEEAERALRNALNEKGLAYDVNEGDGAFYGPKIDIKLRDAIGRYWQCATIQCDFALPEKFDLNYVGSDGKNHRPVMLHRVIFGSLERFIGTLIEHYAGNFPLWLAPEQVVLLALKPELEPFVRNVEDQFKAVDIRCGVDVSTQTLNKKIRCAELRKVPYMLVIGPKEAESDSVSVRSKTKGDLGLMKVAQFIEFVTSEIDKKTI